MFNSLADMMAMAGILPEEGGVFDGDAGDARAAASMIEAELNFSCMDPGEYQQKSKETFFSARRAYLITTTRTKIPSRIIRTTTKKDDGRQICCFGTRRRRRRRRRRAVSSAPRLFALVDCDRSVGDPGSRRLCAKKRVTSTGHSSSEQLLLAAPPFDRCDVGAFRCAGLMAAPHFCTRRAAGAATTSDLPPRNCGRRKPPWPLGCAALTTVNPRRGWTLR